MGVYYYYGRGVSQNYAEAVKWYRKSADQGIAEAQYSLGRCYEYGYGVSKNYVEAENWYRKAADQGHVESQYSLGHRYDVSLYYVDAVKWYRKAADQGHAEAQSSLGYCYYYGRGVSQDYAEAVKWYRKAADQGNAYAQHNLGNCYYDGHGVGQDYAEAIKWYRKAADQGDATAQALLGALYGEGRVVKQDYAEAIKWYRKVADQGNARAQFNLGVYYYYGRGVSQNYAEAVKWYRKSADQGVAEAQYGLGVCYYYGHGVSQDYAEAVKWYRKAADQGNKDAQYTLGICYEYGRGVTKNIEEAKRWYKSSASLGNKEAKEQLAKLEGNVSPTPTPTKQIASMTWLAYEPTTEQKDYPIKIGVKSDSKIEEVSVYVNDVLTRGINPVVNDGYNMTIDRKVTLNDGKNTIKVSVKNAGGVAVTEKNVIYTAKHATPIVQQKRIALVMGNANYRDVDMRLKNPVNDANDVADKLEGLGFKVIRSLDQSKQGMEIAINEFGRQAKNYEVALFYYAGHGMRLRGDNYLIPVDANLPEESYVQYNCTNANLVLDLMARANCPMKIMILDACRNNPFARSWNRDIKGGGLSIMNAPKGTFIAFSTAPGDVAQDGADRNSPYTSALLQTLDVPNLSITDFFQEVLEKVASKTNERQIPWTSNSFRGKFYFNKK